MCLRVLGLQDKRWLQHNRICNFDLLHSLSGDSCMCMPVCVHIVVLELLHQLSGNPCASVWLRACTSPSLTGHFHRPMSSSCPPSNFLILHFHLRKSLRCLVQLTICALGESRHPFGDLSCFSCTNRKHTNHHTSFCFSSQGNKSGTASEYLACYHVKRMLLIHKGLNFTLEIVRLHDVVRN